MHKFPMCFRWGCTKIKIFLQNGNSLVYFTKPSAYNSFEKKKTANLTKEKPSLHQNKQNEVGASKQNYAFLPTKMHFDETAVAFDTFSFL